MGHALGVLVFILSLAVNAHAAQCGLESADLGASSGRVRVISFPDGRTVYIVGHNHGDRDLPFELSRLLAGGPEGAQDFAGRLAELRSSVRQAEEHSDQDLVAFRALLAAHPEIKIVGMEATDEVVRNNLRSYANLYADFMEAAQGRGVAADAGPVVRVAVGPISYLQINEPGLFTGREIIGFESEEAIAAADQAEAEAERLYGLLKEQAAGDGEFLGNVAGTDFQLWMAYEKFDPERDSARYLHSIGEAAIPAQYRDLTLQWAAARLNEMAALKRRETAAARLISAAGGSAVIFIGAKHLDGITQEIEKSCRLFDNF